MYIEKLTENQIKVLIAYLVADDAKSQTTPNIVCGFFDLVPSNTRKNQVIPPMHIPIIETACK